MASGKELESLAKVVKVLQSHQGGLWIRELARKSEMHMETARRLIKAHPQLFQEYADFTAYNINLKIIRLKHPNMTVQELAKFLELSKKIAQKKSE